MVPNILHNWNVLVFLGLTASETNVIQEYRVYFWNVIESLAQGSYTSQGSISEVGSF